MAWALMIILTIDGTMPPPPSWHATREDCEAHAAVRVYHHEIAGRSVSWVRCQQVRIPPARRVETFVLQMEPVP